MLPASRLPGRHAVEGRLGVTARGVTLALALAVAGCTVGPAYRRPSIPAPSAWSTPTANAQAAWPSADWWRSFGSPQLDELIGEAERANDDIGAAIARIREAEAEVTVATAPLLPAIDASGTATRQRQFIPLVGGGTLTYNTFVPEVDASYELDFWGKNRATRAAAVAAADASRYDRVTVELTVMTSVADTYFTTLELEDQLQIARDNLESSEETLRGLTVDETVGTTTSLDVAQQAAEVATLSAAIPPLEQQLQQSLDALAILVGRAPQAFKLPPGSLAGISQPALAPGLPSGLLARRPDVAEAEAQLIAANADIQVARATFFPSIELTAAGGYESTALETLLEPGSRIFSLAAGLTQPIFQGGAILGQYRYSKARYAELLADYHKAVISAFGNVEDALVAVRETSDQQQRQQNAADTARHAYELSQAQFHAGTINILTVLSTETALFTAEDALAQVKLAHLQAIVGLFNALGGGWQR